MYIYVYICIYIYIYIYIYVSQKLQNSRVTWLYMYSLKQLNGPDKSFLDVRVAKLNKM